MLAFPTLLRPGDTIGVTSPSAGASGPGAERVAFCVGWLRDRGYHVIVGECMDGSGITSAPADVRAAELTAMLCDPDIRCVLPPWGGEQSDSGLVAGWWRFQEDPHAVAWRHVDRGGWRLHGRESVSATGRLIGGCIETLTNLAGTPFGDVAAFGERHAHDGLIFYLEAAEDDAASICRNLHGLRLAGWFEHATAILIGRTDAGDNPKMTQDEAVLDALGRLDLPIVFDVEIGHVPPHLPLVNGALARLTVDGETRQITQELR